MPSDYILQGETDPTEMTIVVDLVDATGAPVGGLNAASVTINLAKRGANYAAASVGTTLTEKTGGVKHGPYELQLVAADCNVAGDLCFEITGAAIVPCRGIVTVHPSSRTPTVSVLLNALLATVMDPTNVGGAGYPLNAQTFQQQWNLFMAYMFGPGEGLDGTAGSLGPPCVGDPQASPAPHRAEFTVVAGKRRFTKLDGT